jgi:hypothetical protein
MQICLNVIFAKDGLHYLDQDVGKNGVKINLSIFETIIKSNMPHDV